ncbi:tetratricopeptide repeat protein [[Actinomadura] parvosata]|uniref:tetratricopeptide repeat protein n=1 Tax=[Actinomadura] parvosata TaxID=1955412 RepID=UPI00406C2507
MLYWPFVGREIEMALADDMLQRNSAVRILGIWGTSGIGKTRLLYEIGVRARTKGYEYASIDLGAGATGSRPDGLDQYIATDLVRAFIRLSTAKKSVQRDCRDRYYAQLRRAHEELKCSAPAQINMTATRGGHIEKAPISYAQAHPAADLYVAYRMKMVDVVSDAVDALKPSDALIGIDGLEWLVRHDGLLAGTSREGAMNWLTHALLPQLANTAPHLRFILASWIRPRFPPTLLGQAEAWQLRPWAPAETAIYLRHRGLTDSHLADDIHRTCAGTPAWISMVADTCGKDGLLANRSWITQVTRNEPAAEWLQETFLDRLDPSGQRLVQAASVLREVSRDSLSALMGGKVTDHDFARLCRYSFVQVVRKVDGRCRRKVHDLVRTAVLSGDSRVADITALHKLAAAWYSAQGDDMEAAYHRFATGDLAGLGPWEEALDQALQHYDLAAAQNLLDSATAPETGGRERLEATGLDTIIDLYLARHAYLGGFLSQAQRAYEFLIRRLTDSPDRRHLAKVHRWLGDLLCLRDEYSQAEEETRRALQLYVEIADSSGEASARRRLGVLLRMQDDYPQAEVEIQAALRIHQVVGNQRGEADARLELARLYCVQKDFDRAEEQARAALLLYNSINARWKAAFAHHGLGVVHRARKEYDCAEAEIRTALAIFQELGEPMGEAISRSELGLQQWAKENYNQAEKETRKALALYQDIGNRWGEANALHGLGVLHWTQGEYEHAEQGLRAALRLYRDIGDRSDESNIRRHLDALLKERSSGVRADMSGLSWNP